MTTVVVIPTYQEAESIASLIADVRSHLPDAELLIVDDSSPDGTGQIVEQLAATDPAVHILHRPGKQGLGVAYRAGFAWALDHGADRIVQMDADRSHRPEDLPALVAGIETADLAIGSRWVPGGSVVNWPLIRQLISRGGTFYARVMLRIPVHDATAGFRAWQRQALEGIDVAGVESQGYCFQIDMALRAVDAGLDVVEVPITFVERERGNSKMSGAIVREALWRVTVWGVQRRWTAIRSAFSR